MIFEKGTRSKTKDRTVDPEQFNVNLVLPLGETSWKLKSNSRGNKVLVRARTGAVQFAPVRGMRTTQSARGKLSGIISTSDLITSM